ncbi:MAG: Two component regulator, sensor protein [Pedosphaera sp.]|nr:Two component regulator, sensor protein [Pedosphaera sp.]
MPGCQRCELRFGNFRLPFGVKNWIDAPSMKLADHDPSADMFRLVWALMLICRLQSGATAFASAPVSAATNTTIQYHSRTWQMDEGLPQNSVETLTQSKEGYLWLGTQRGLARFDGIQFKVFDAQNTPGLKNSSITALLQGRDGSLWIGTAGGGLARLKDGTFSSYTLSDDPRGNNIKTIFQSKDGSLWVGTLGGLFHEQNGTWKRFTKQDGLGDNVVRSLCEDGDRLWIGTGFGVNILENGVITTRNGVSEKAVRMVLKDRHGTLWFALTSGLGRLQDGQFTLFTHLDGLADNNVGFLYEDRRGELWIGTYGGLSRVVGEKLVTEKDSLGTYYDRVNAISEDEEGDIWIGARDGLFELRAKQFTSFTRQDSLAHNNVMSVLEDRKGNIWLGTWGGA